MIEQRTRPRSARTWLGNWILTTVCALLSAAAPVLAPEPATAADRIETAALMPGTVVGRETALPAILDPADAARYQAIAKLQDDAHWAAANAAIATLQDRILIGHVLAH